MTEEKKASAQNPAATYQFDDDFFMDAVVCCRDVVEEANRSAKNVKQAVAWTIGSLYAVWLKKAGSAAKFVEDLKTLGASEEKASAIRFQLQECAMMRDVLAPAAKTIKKHGSESAFANNAWRPLGQWLGEDTMLKAVDWVFDFLRAVAAVAYRVPTDKLAEAVERDAALSEDVRQSLVTAVRFYEKVEAEKLRCQEMFFADDDEEAAEDPAVSLSADVWLRFSSRLTGFQKMLFIATYVQLSNMGRQLAATLSENEFKADLQYSSAVVSALCLQLTEDEATGKQIAAIMKKKATQNVKAMLPDCARAFVSSLKELSSDDAEKIAKVFKTTGKLVVAYTELPEKVMLEHLKTINVTLSEIVISASLATQTAMLIEQNEDNKIKEN